MLTVLVKAADAIRNVLTAVEDWSALGTRPSQYAIDLRADDAAVGVLTEHDFDVFSEESGHHARGGTLAVHLDPVDGSYNASRGVAPHGPSLAAIDDEGLLAAVVVDLASGTRHEAVRGGGARLDGEPITTSTCRTVAGATLSVSGRPSQPLPGAVVEWWAAAAHELCAVADGRLDGFVDCEAEGHAPWDYLAGLLICREAGAATADAFGHDLVPEGPTAPGMRRWPLVAATPELLADISAALTWSPPAGRHPTSTA